MGRLILGRKYTNEVQSARVLVAEIAKGSLQFASTKSRQVGAANNQKVTKQTRV
jgi:hypothetical protein